MHRNHARRLGKLEQARLMAVARIAQAVQATFAPHEVAALHSAITKDLACGVDVQFDAREQAASDKLNALLHRMMA